MPLPLGTIKHWPGNVTLPDSTSLKAVLTLSQADNTASALEKTARTLNLAEYAGITTVQLKLLLSGPAAQLANTSSALYVAHQTTLSTLYSAGIEVAVCSQALASQSILPAQVAPGVTVVLSALTSSIDWQQQGFALLPQD
ncbi:DsrE family protein [Gallaecimonas sp. GXIMD1310]|uniref:DsrE family protein n=1 Tax=Gallaecimonas sp. GXIMD1310 TaxID=3131926 RepID=UPI003243646C